MQGRYHQRTIRCDMAKSAELLLLVPPKKSARKKRVDNEKDKKRRKFDQQLSLFPARYDLSGLSIDCDISSRHLFALDDTFSLLNDLHNFDRQGLNDCLRLSNVSEADIDKLSRVYDASTKPTLSKLMLVLRPRRESTP